MFLKDTLRNIKKYDNGRRAMVRHAAERCPAMRHRIGQPGIDYPIIPPNPQPRGVPNGFPRTCYHGWYPGICGHTVCISDPRETGPYRGGEILRLPHQPPPKIYYIDRRPHGHPFHGGMKPHHPHHLYHGDLHYPYVDDFEEDHFGTEYWADDEDEHSISSSELMTMGMPPTYNPYSAPAGYGPHHAGLHIPLSYGHHHGHHHQNSLASSSLATSSLATEESY